MRGTPPRWRSFRLRPHLAVGLGRRQHHELLKSQERGRTPTTVDVHQGPPVLACCRKPQELRGLWRARWMFYAAIGAAPGSRRPSFAEKSRSPTGKPARVLSKVLPFGITLR